MEHQKKIIKEIQINILQQPTNIAVSKELYTVNAPF